jgi:hypothetical protein
MKTYTISEDLYKAIIESVYENGKYAKYINKANKSKHEKDTINNAMKIIQDQQYIYED